MARFTVHKTKNYTVMSNYHFRNSSLSFKAMGLLSFMLSLPDDWDFSVEGLAKCARDGRDSISAGLRELEDAGHLVRRQVRGEHGRIVDTEYDLYEEPIVDSSSTMNRMEFATSQLEDELPHTGFPKMEKSATVENGEIEKNTENTELSPVTDFPEVVDMIGDLPVTEKPLTEKPPTDKPLTENSQQINTNIINTKILSTKEINTDDLSSSSGNITSVRRRIDYDSAVKATSKVIVDAVLEELIKRQEILKVIDAQTFKKICINIAMYCNQPIINKSAYITKCIDNIWDAMEINKNTLVGILRPEKIEKQGEQGYIPMIDER